MASSSGVTMAPAPSSAAFLRDRGRTSSGEIPRLSTPPLPRRRSSVLSYASDTKQSVQSSASEYILPGLGMDQNKTTTDESSHWHSSPLAFALLPAVGGLIFTNGSAFVTDILLLGLAAVFLNWSCRLPWQWYHSAQAISSASSYKPPVIYSGKDSPASKTSSNNKDDDMAVQSDDSDGQQEVDDRDTRESTREDAAEKLRTQELLALISTFVLPALAAYLLHVIRGQLSNKSTVLVSDYNLTIFLLAAEIRPFRQLIKLITNNTLHLQRIATGNDLAGQDTEKAADFESRLEVLEAKVAEPTVVTPLSSVQKEELSQLSVEVRKRYEPRIEAIERAIRRYEKRVTTLSIATEARMQAAELKLQDALSLAAVAAETSQRPTVVSATATYMSRMAVMPLELACAALVWPVKTLEHLTRMILGGGPKKLPKKGERLAKSSARPARKYVQEEVQK